MRAFLIRLLQVFWVLGAVFFPIAILASALFLDGADSMEMVPLFIFLGVTYSAILTIAQYLIFGKLHPLSAFDGSLL